MQQFPARVKVVRATTVRALCVRVCVLGGVRGMPPTAYHPHALIVEPLKNLSCLVWLAGKIADIATAKPMPLTEANFILEYSYTPTPTPTPTAGFFSCNIYSPKNPTKRQLTINEASWFLGLVSSLLRQLQHTMCRTEEKQVATADGNKIEKLW